MKFNQSKLNSILSDIKIIKKSDSFLMKLLQKILFFTHFMEFSSVFSFFGKTYLYLADDIYLDYQSGDDNCLSVIFHELNHVNQHKQVGLFYSLMYLFPAIGSLFCIPLFIMGHWMIGVLCLGFLLPLPIASFRKNFEFESYIISLYTQYQCNQKLGSKFDLKTSADIFASEISGSDYYFSTLNLNHSLNQKFYDQLAVIQQGQNPLPGNPTIQLVDSFFQD